MDERYVIAGSTLKDIADSIRTKTEKEDSIKPENMADEIASIQIGIPEEEVNAGKSLIADAVTEKGIDTFGEDSFETIAENIESIQCMPTSRFGNGIGQISTFELMFCGRGDAAQYVRPLIIRR